jgi:hypothetical protein
MKPRTTLTLTIKNAQGQPVWELESSKAYISLDKASGAGSKRHHDEKQSQCKICQWGMKGEY